MLVWWPTSATAKLTFPRQDLSIAKFPKMTKNLIFLPLGRAGMDWDGFPTCSQSLFQVSMPKIKTATPYDDNVELEDNIDEVLIKYYFYCGFQYADILDFLITFHNVEISERTLHGN